VTNSNFRQIVKSENGQVLVDQARWCDTFSSKLRGFTFKRHLAPGEGLVLVEQADSRVNTSIHMLFVFFDLGVIWADNSGKVVDTRVARSWRPAYVPKAAARYVIETSPEVIQNVQVGETIKFIDRTTSDLRG
jgi:uncharacterized membrane protein (UPF0127 family)